MRKTVRAIFNSPELLTANQIAESEILRTLIKKQVPIAIEDALVDNKIYAAIFEINDSKQFIEIHKNHWEQALETCLVWYVDEEDYEMCNHIKNLIHAIHDKYKSKLSLKKKKKDGEGF
jgi:hypothetical protein